MHTLSEDVRFALRTLRKRPWFTAAAVLTRRTREVGVRMVLGAEPGDILALVLRGELFRVVPGLLAGMVLAGGLARLLRAFLLGLSPSDPLTFGVVLALLLVALTLASLSPALRAAKIEAAQALRYD